MKKVGTRVAMVRQYNMKFLFIITTWEIRAIFRVFSSLKKIKRKTRLKKINPMVLNDNQPHTVDWSRAYRKDTSAMDNVIIP